MGLAGLHVFGTSYIVLFAVEEWRRGLIWYIKMSLKSIVRELRELKDGMGSMSRRGWETKQWHRKRTSHIAPDQAPPPSSEVIQQGRWSNLPPELLLDIIRRVEESETSWPARAVLVFCASVCKSWRTITREIVQTPEQCGRLTFPISLKQVATRLLLFFLSLFQCEVYCIIIPYDSFCAYE